MKFIMQAGRLVEEPGVFTRFSEWFIEKETDVIFRPIGNAIKYEYAQLLEMLPDICGFGAILAGVLIIIGAMIGRGGMMRPAAYYACFLIIAVCLLMRKGA